MDGRQRYTICFGNTVYNMAYTCSATGGCNCILSAKERCTSRCTDLADGSAECK